MLDNFLEMIRNVGIFIIFAQAVVHFRPKASYEKYLKVLVSIIVLVMLMIPCFQVWGNVESFFSSVEEYETFFAGREQAVWMESYVEESKEDFVEANGPVEPVMIEPVEVIE